MHLYLKSTSTNPGRFERVAEAFNEGSKARMCAESSGSEHSAVNETSSDDDLSDLVHLYLESADDDEVADDQEQTHEKIVEVEKKTGSINKDFEGSKTNSETKDMLKSLLSGSGEGFEVITKIRDETELAFNVIGMSSSENGFKRQLMARLRQKGFNAGLCKSRWEKTDRFPAGTFEYVDVIVSGNRYIVEVYLAGEFTIARPTNHYTSILEAFPQIFVGKPDQLKQVVKIMCRASKQSLKKNDMHIPPWRSNGYMQAKWFSLYKRTINAVTEMVGTDSRSGKRSVGFDTTPTPMKVYYCREELERRRDVEMGKKVGKLGQLFV
ncbi:hypothetical protein C5167_026939 [Papaver somniferum]|uniref:uncharacterized protein LOC113341435 n=1 Tax=Papaver somniferum TaxID=3469 RepID=UPI000E6F6C4C|nr:uncharacterized protein LOC113341435 [Papaver somniferum]RZC92306.1 hypothetical protein C5167_026939 [Papaver somniferum]